MFFVVIPFEFERPTSASFSRIHYRHVEISCGEERKTYSRVRGIMSRAWFFLLILLFVQDEGQGTSHGSPVYLPLPPAPLPGSAIRDRSRQLPSAELRHSEQETDEDDADTTPDQIPLISMPPSAQREESGASVVCESPRRSAAGSPSVARSSPGREVPSPGREVPATEVESSLQLASIDNPRYIHCNVCNCAECVCG